MQSLQALFNQLQELVTEFVDVVKKSGAYRSKRKTGKKELRSFEPCRREIAGFLKGQHNGSLSPRESIVAHITDAGYAVPDLSSLVKVS